MIKVWLYRLATRLMGVLFWRGKAPANLEVRDLAIPGREGKIGVRIYTPPSREKLPAIVYFHGGGFVLGDLDAIDGTCRSLADTTKHIVVSVDYRLAPEAPFPAAAHDCLDAVQWVADNAVDIGADANHIFVAGDSAGGNLAAVCALNDRDSRRGIIKGQILVYPVTHHYSNDTPSYREKATGYGLTRKMMVWFWDLYYQDSRELEDSQAAHPLSTPLAEDDLSGLAPALVLTAEHDPLRDEGIEYAKKISDAGVQVQHTLYKGAQHGFFASLGPTEEHKQAIAEITAWLVSQSNTNLD